MDREQQQYLQQFLRMDPQGFAQALVNVIDTHVERRSEHEMPFHKERYPGAEEREQWAVDFLINHDNGKQDPLYQKYRVTVREQVVYQVDVLGRSPEEAMQLGRDNPLQSMSEVSRKIVSTDYKEID